VIGQIHRDVNDRNADADVEAIGDPALNRNTAESLFRFILSAAWITSPSTKLGGDNADGAG
jgi:hypothetical protein